MGVLRNIAIGIFVISFLTFVALFGRLPALRKTPIGWLQRLLCIYVPNGLTRLDGSLTGGKITRRSTRLGHYLFYEKNPIVLATFLFILTGSAILFLWNAAHRLPTRLLMPLPLLLGLPYVLTYLCVSCTAHYITPANHDEHMRDYPFDRITFRPATVCRTCNFVKPARSKHCNFCGKCIAKADHHCPWVNNCLGRGNYHYFLALLLSLSLIQSYGAFLSWHILGPYWSVNSQNQSFSWARLDAVGNAIMVVVDRGGISIAGVGLLAAATACLPLGLLTYHIYLIWAGMTTNESQKWTEWKEDMADGYVFKAKRQDLNTRNRLRESSDGLSGLRNPALLAFDDDEDVDWPVKMDYVLVRTRDGKPPYGQETLWTRVWSLNDIDNIYDLGAARNFRDALRGH